jgi:outer membrane protein insertion porin family
MAAPKHSRIGQVWLLSIAAACAFNPIDVAAQGSPASASAPTPAPTPALPETATPAPTTPDPAAPPATGVEGDAAEASPDGASTPGASADGTDAPDGAEAPDGTEAASEANAVAAGPGAPRTACDGKPITRIDVKGHGRVSADDILATIRLRKGVPCLDAEVTRDVRSLWDMGYFQDIEVDVTPEGTGVALTFRVKERPAIGEVVYEGLDELEESDLQETVTLEQGSVLSEPNVRSQLEKIRALYAEKGFFLAQVRYELDPRPNNEVTVRFVIDEGEEVTVRRVRFIGNKALSDDELLAVMQTGETGFFSFLAGNDTYRKEIFDEDLNRVQALYYDYGYLTVELGTPRIELSPDRRYVDAAITIHEGPRFKVGRVKVAEVDDNGREIEPLFGRKHLREAIDFEAGDWFSRSVIAQNLQDLTREYRDEGYARAQLNPQTDLHMETRIVDVLVTIRRGPLVYIHRIEIKGNDKTRDEVLRREARIAEGQLYSQTLVERGKDRMMSLGYFESVDISEEDGSTPDRIIIHYEVKERPTGTFQLGAGFSSQETFLLTGQVQQENLFGRGQSLAFNLQLSGIRQLAQIRFVEPYLHGSDWTLALEVFKMLRQQRSFNRDSTGGNITFGHPLYFIDEDLSIFLNYHLEQIDITPATGGAFGTTGEHFERFRFVPLRNLFRSGLTSSVRVSLSYDTRNNRLFPSEGVLATASTEVSDAVTLSDSNFIRHRVNFRGYLPLVWSFVGKLNVEWGLITSRDGLGVPIFERYFLGGITDVRGFPIQSIGPRVGSPSTYNDPTFGTVPERGVAFGGNMQAYYNLEIEFPIIESVGIKGVVFTDAGNTWNMDQSLCQPKPRFDDDQIDPCGVHPLNLRTSWGFGVRWFSPLGPLRFEWGFPFNPRPPYEDDVEFQFTVGNAF